MNPPDVGTTERTYTIEEYERLPDEDGYRTELVEGKLVREQLPGPEHGWSTLKLAARILQHVEANHLGLALAETGFVLADDPPTIRGPDIAFIARENLPEGGLPRGYWRIPPDLAVEIVSPSNTRAEIREKVLEYLAAGARLVWVVEPRTRSVTVYRSRTDVRVLKAPETLGGGDLLPGFALPLAELFASPEFPED
ncbi:MAG: Uma2 family endonuclease [Gemmatimonadetes bacterium]|nr:Uma2 family endonuclease [Gemmatimonadota bacterium]